MSSDPHKYVREQPYSISTEMMILRAAPLYITTTHKDFLLHLEKLKDLFPSSFFILRDGV